MRKEFLPFYRPLVGDEEIAETVATLKSDWLTTGPKTHEFEKRFAEYIGARHALALNSCTAGLHIALVGYNLGAGDEIITSPLTFCSTVNVIIHAGATPVLADIEPDTGCVNPDEIKLVATENTRAIIPVHYGGHTADMDAIQSFADGISAKVIEDAAHGLPARYKGALVGGAGNATAFSFYATKNLVTGEGGMLTTNDDVLAERARILSLHGISKDAWKRYSQSGSWFYEVVDAGFKYNMTDIQASLGLHQLEKLSAFQERRREIVAMYNEGLKALPVLLPQPRNYCEHSWHLYVIRLANAAGIERGEFIEELKKRNIGASVHFIPIHHHPYYRKKFGWKPGDFPVADNFYKRAVTLPLYPKMTDDDVRDVIAAIKDILE